MIKKMIKKLSDIIIANFVWKLVSVFLALALWFIVVSETNPISTKQYTLNLSIDNLNKITESNYVLLNEDALRNTMIDINIRSSRNDFAELSKRERAMRAYIDFKPIDYSRTSMIGEAQSMSVKFSLPSGLLSGNYELLNINPITVDILLDKSVTKTFPVSVDKIGDAAEGYVFLQPVPNPETVRITGAQSIIDKISSVRAEVSVSGASEPIGVMKELTIFDEAGKDLTSDRLTLSTKEVEVSIPINKYAKIDISMPTVYGTPTLGSHVTAIDWEPKSVYVVGSEDDVDDIEVIELAPISVDSLDTTLVEVYDLRNNILAAKSNCNIVNGTPHEVTVTITLQNDVNKEIVLLHENIIRLGAPSEYSLDESQIRLTVTGLESTLKDLTERYVSAIIDLTGLAPGTYDIQSQIYLPAGVSLVGDEPTVRVTIPAAVKDAVIE